MFHISAPRGFGVLGTPALVAQRGRRLHHRTCDRLLAATRPIGWGVGRGRAAHDGPKSVVEKLRSWSAILGAALSFARTEESLYSGSSSGGREATPAAPFSHDGVRRLVSTGRNKPAGTGCGRVGQA